MRVLMISSKDETEREHPIEFYGLVNSILLHVIDISEEELKEVAWHSLENLCSVSSKNIDVIFLFLQGFLPVDLLSLTAFAPKFGIPIIVVIREHTKMSKKSEEKLRTTKGVRVLQTPIGRHEIEDIWDEIRRGQETTPVEVVKAI